MLADEGGEKMNELIVFVVEPLRENMIAQSWNYCHLDSMTKCWREGVQSKSNLCSQAHDELSSLTGTQKLWDDFCGQTDEVH